MAFESEPGGSQFGSEFSTWFLLKNSVDLCRSTLHPCLLPTIPSILYENHQDVMYQGPRITQGWVCTCLCMAHSCGTRPGPGMDDEGPLVVQQYDDIVEFSQYRSIKFNIIIHSNEI